MALAISVLICVSACGKPVKTMTYKEALTSGLDSDGGSEVTAPPTEAQLRFQAARQVFSDRCTQCHTTFGTIPEAQWVSTNKVVPRDSAASFLISKIRSSGVAGANNMPGDGTTLSTAQIQTLRTWIDQMP